MIDKKLVLGCTLLAFLVSSVFLSSGLVDCASITSYTNCTSYGCFRIKNSVGDNRVIIDKFGNLDTYHGTIQQNSTYINPNPSFRLQNSTGTFVASMAVGGRIDIAGTLTDNTGTYCSPPTGSFVIKDNSGNCVFYISSAGNMWARGEVCRSAAIS